GRLYGMGRQEIARRIEELTGMFDLGPFLDARCETLSTGQLQRVSIARVVLHDPPLLVLDEPANGLDVLTSESLFRFIRAAGRRGTAVILSMHQISAIENLCTRVGLMHEGILIRQGIPAEICRETRQPDLQSAFIHLVSGEDVGDRGRRS
ncbi:MAG TPA: ATP-binding cassette domain-containing protein, partial [Candidatus Hydrogenedentes bacterium]|nr:ATP-binding cassette domain-containing protein [Candidatus Hydrogenedentota bacterium]